MGRRERTNKIINSSNKKNEEKMEIICRIISQGELQEREYTTQQGVKEKFASMPFVLARGRLSIVCHPVKKDGMPSKTTRLMHEYWFLPQ